VPRHFEEVWFFTLQSSTDGYRLRWRNNLTIYIGFNSLVGGSYKEWKWRWTQPICKYRSHNNTLPIVCSYVPMLESIIIIILNYSRDVFCPKFATLTVSIVMFQKIRVKRRSQWCSRSNPNWWCLCKFFRPLPPLAMSSSQNDVDDISKTLLMNFVVVEFVT
jgi:hypothetical protein